MRIRSWWKYQINLKSPFLVLKTSFISAILNFRTRYMTSRVSLKDCRDPTVRLGNLRRLGLLDKGHNSFPMLSFFGFVICFDVCCLIYIIS